LQTLLIAGTGAQVGKTVVLTALIAYWQRYRSQQVGIMKPIDCGRQLDELISEPDCQRFKRLFKLAQPASEITPIMLHASVLPPIAAAESGQRIDFDHLWQALQTLQQRHDLVLLEALGGLGTPLTPETTVADLAWDWQIPTVLVVPVQSNMVADAVTNVALAHQSRLHLKGIILNHLHPSSSQPAGTTNSPDHQAEIKLIQTLTRKPVLGCIPYLDPDNLSQLVRAAADLDLERLLPGLEQALLG